MAARYMSTEWIQQAVKDQRAWMESCGGNHAGYVARYGDPGVTPDYSGKGGTAIYNADLAALANLVRRAKEKNVAI